jgi:L-2-hydroxyglutarate oxidase LhgO
MMQLLAEAEHHGAMLACNTRMIAGAVADNGIHLTLQDRDGSATHCMAQHVINCAGLHASAVARSITGLPARCAPQTYFCKGHYFSYTGGKPPFSRLIYPIPERAGLGIHVTLDLAGQIKFGPDTVWLEDTWREHESYDVPLALRDKFLSAIGRYFPSITAANLQPAYAGVRPKLVPAGSSSTQDFVIQAPQHHGIAGFYNLLGIESPGLTSCLAIAQYVHALYTAATHRHNPCTISTLDD